MISIENLFATPCTLFTYRMNPYDRVLRLHRLTTDMSSITASIFCLVETAVLSAQALEESFDGLRQTRVRRSLRSPRCVTTSGRDGEEGEDGDARGLVLV